MLRNTYLNIFNFTNKVNAASFGVGKKKELALIRRVKLTQEFEEAREVVLYIKLVPLG